MARYHEFFVGRKDVAFDQRIRLGNAWPALSIPHLIDFYAKPLEPAQHRLANGSGILADARREHETIKTAHGSCKHSGKEADAIDEILQRQCRPRTGARKQVSDVVADARQTLQSAVMVEKRLDGVRLHVLFVEEIEHHTRVQLPRSRPHRQSIEGGKPHRALNALAGNDRAHRCAAAQMGDDDTPSSNLGCRYW